VCTAQFRQAPTMSMSTDISETCWSNFKYFIYFIIILIVSTNYIFEHLLDHKVF